MNLDASATAVIVVDMQNCFAREDGSLFAPPSGAVIDPIAEFLETAEDAGCSLYFTQDTHTEDQFETQYSNYDEFDRWGEHAVEGTEGWKIVDALQPYTTKWPVVQKETYDAFHNTDFEQRLSADGIDTVLVVGTLANVCVLHTASSAAKNDYRTIVLEDLVGYIEEDDKEYALDHVDWLFGEVSESENVTFD